MALILRTVLALLAGFSLMTAAVYAFTALSAKKAPAWVGPPGQPRPSYRIASILWSFLAAALGGFVTASVAHPNPLPTVLMLAIIVLALSAISALEARGRQPLLYQLALAIISPLGVTAGGLLRLHLL